jgi:ABC-2 type transport system ATP-binding protein
MKGEALSQRVNEMIERVGLPSHRHKKIGELSKGYRQRVGLAQAMIHDPEVLILDEPTTGLDPNQIVEIRQVIRDFGREKTVIFSTHIMQEVQQLCERVVIINQGEIVADEQVSLLRDKNKGQKLLRVEFSGGIEVEKLKHYAGVISVVEKLPNVFEVSYDNKKDIRPELFKLASENGWTLVGLSEIENSLEKVFQDLTKTRS